MKNKLDTKNISILYCTTGEILADFYTKPLQGSLFRKFRYVIMGLKHIRILKMGATLSDQECVGNTVEIGLNKPVPMKNHESNNIAAKVDGIGKIEKINNDANTNKAIDIKQMYA